MSLLVFFLIVNILASIGRALYMHSKGYNFIASLFRPYSEYVYAKIGELPKPAAWGTMSAIIDISAIIAILTMAEDLIKNGFDIYLLERNFIAIATIIGIFIVRKVLDLFVRFNFIRFSKLSSSFIFGFLILPHITELLLGIKHIERNHSSNVENGRRMEMIYDNVVETSSTAAPDFLVRENKSSEPAEFQSTMNSYRSQNELKKSLGDLDNDKLDVMFGRSSDKLYIRSKTIEYPLVPYNAPIMHHNVFSVAEDVERAREKKRSMQSEIVNDITNNSSKMRCAFYYEGDVAPQVINMPGTKNGYYRMDIGKIARG